MEKFERIIKFIAGAFGAALSFFCRMPPVMMVLMVKASHELLVECAVYHPAGLVVHMALTAVYVSEPVGVFVQIGQGSFIRWQRVSASINDPILYGILAGFLYGAILQAGFDDCHIGAFSRINTADHLIQPHHHIHDQLRGFEENRNPQEL